MVCSVLSKRSIVMTFFFNVRVAVPELLPSDTWRPFVKFQYDFAAANGGLDLNSTMTIGWDDMLAKIFNEPYLEPLWTKSVGGNWKRCVGGLCSVHMRQ
jgi:hypothetical protein